ncbi:MAG TPA: tetratricopeptide repeat protein, partial [Thermoguttaceae bacterium]|nr:tetratricopeptide repeat protein [Thermoguttaceae bacterium]
MCRNRRVGILVGMFALAGLWGCGQPSGQQQVLEHPADRQALALTIDGLEHFDRGDFPQAIVRFSRALEKNPDQAAPYFYRALAYRRLEKFEEALKDLQQSLAKGLQTPWQTQAYLAEGECLHRLGRWEEALKVYTDTIRQCPEL